MTMVVMIKYQNLWMIYFFFPIWFPGLNRTLIGPCFLVEKHTEIESSFIWVWLSTLFPGCAGSGPTFRFLIKVWSTYHPLIRFTNRYWALGSYHWLELRFELEGLGLDLNPMLQPSLWESCWDFWTHVQLIINQHLISHLALFLEFTAASGTPQGREMAQLRPIQAFPQALHRTWGTKCICWATSWSFREVQR